MVIKKNTILREVFPPNHRIMVKGKNIRYEMYLVSYLDSNNPLHICAIPSGLLEDRNLYLIEEIGDELLGSD